MTLKQRDFYFCIIPTVWRLGGEVASYLGIEVKHIVKDECTAR